MVDKTLYSLYITDWVSGFQLNLSYNTIPKKLLATRDITTLSMLTHYQAV